MDIRRGENEHVQERQRVLPEGPDSVVATEKRPVAEPMQDLRPHAPGLMVKERNPYIELDASVQMWRIGLSGAIEDVGGLRPPTGMEHMRSIIKGETG